MIYIPQNYSQYIISLMARLCSPGRDEKIRELMALRDPVPLYRGIFEVFTLPSLIYVPSALLNIFK